MVRLRVKVETGGEIFRTSLFAELAVAAISFW